LIEINMETVDFSASAEKALEWCRKQVPADLYDRTDYLVQHGVSTSAAVMKDVALGRMEPNDIFPKQAATCLKIHNLLVFVDEPESDIQMTWIK